MGSEGGSYRPNPEFDLGARLNQQIALGDIKGGSLKRAIQGINDLALGAEDEKVVHGALDAMFVYARVRTDQFWGTELYNLGTGNNGLTLWRRKDAAYKAALADDPSERNLDENPPESSRQESTEPLESLLEISPLDDLRSRIGEGATLEAHALGEANEQFGAFEGAPDEKAVYTIAQRAGEWQRRATDRKWVEALLEHPGISVEVINEIWAKRDEL